MKGEMMRELCLGPNGYSEKRKKEIKESRTWQCSKPTPMVATRLAVHWAMS